MLGSWCSGRTYLGQFLYSWWSPSWSECGLQFLCSLRATAGKQYNYGQPNHRQATPNSLENHREGKSGRNLHIVCFNGFFFFPFLAAATWSIFARACNSVFLQHSLWYIESTGGGVIHTQRDEVVVRRWLPAADDCAQVISRRHPWKRHKSWFYNKRGAIWQRKATGRTVAGPIKEFPPPMEITSAKNAKWPVQTQHLCRHEQSQGFTFHLCLCRSNQQPRVHRSDSYTPWKRSGPQSVTKQRHGFCMESAAPDEFCLTASLGCYYDSQC